MEKYAIKMVSGLVNWAEIDALEVKTYSWNCEYRPEVTFKVAFVEGEGFYVKANCVESDPRATYTVPNSSVCRDSCLEFFAAFDVTRPEIYINYEINPNGCVLAQFGTNTDRPFIDELGAAMPTPKVCRDENNWGWELFISLEVLDKLFGKIEYKEGTVIRANCFKCGDDTAQRHYGSWQPIDWPYPSFHRPQFFGEMTLVK